MTTKVAQAMAELMRLAEVDDNQLSKITKVAKANISRLRNDPKANPTLATLKPLAEFFGVTVSQLLGEAPLNVDQGHGQVAYRVPLLANDALLEARDDVAIKASQWLSTDYTVSEHAFAYKVLDTTLSPMFPYHSALIIDKKETYEDGSYLLVKSLASSKPFLRQYVIDGDSFWLKSVKLGPELVEPLNEGHQILGEVIEVRYQVGDI